MKLVNLTLVFTTLFCLSASAALKPKKDFKKNNDWEKSVPAYSEIAKTEEGLDLRIPTDSEYQAMIKNAKSSPQRSIAADETLSDSMMSSELQNFINKILAIKTADELSDLLNKADKDYETYPADLKFYVAQIVPLKAYRGWFYRMRPMLKKSKISHSVLITTAKQLAAARAMYLPEKHWEAAFKFISEPSPNDVSIFKTIADLKRHKHNEVSWQLSKSLMRLNTLNIDRKIIWDNRLVFGVDTFTDSLDRYRLITKADLHRVKSAIYASMAGIFIADSYDTNDILKVNSEYGKLVGFDGWFSEATGSSAKDRAEVLRGFPNYLKYTQSDPKKMQLAFIMIKSSIHELRISWNMSKDASADQWQIFDPAALRPFARVTEKSLNTLESMVSGQTTVRSGVTGKTLNVDFPKLFTNPPADLKAFLPTGFKEMDENEMKSASVKTNSGTARNVSYQVRNYENGRATSWNIQEYDKYFPGIGQTGIDEANRILAQVWGGGLAGMPLLAVSQ